MFTCKICQHEGLTTPSNLPGLICHRCADRLAFASPAMLAACIAADDLLSRLWTPNAPTVSELVLLRGRLRAVIAAASGAEAETVEESWPDTGYVQP